MIPLLLTLTNISVNLRNPLAKIQGLLDRLIVLDLPICQVCLT